MTAGKDVGQDFYAGVLQQLGAPVTPANLSILETWSRYEGTQASFNPLAVGPADNGFGGRNGASKFNSIGVWNYPSAAIGEQGTAIALQNGRYNAIVNALRTNQPVSYWQSNPTIWQEINLWGTHGFSSLLQRQGGVSASAPATTPGGGPVGAQAPSKATSIPYAGKVWGYSWQGRQCPSLATINEQGGGNWFYSLTFYLGQSCVRQRFGIYAAAGVLILMGLKFFGAPNPLSLAEVKKHV